MLNFIITALVTLLVTAAICDLISRTIPNCLCLSIALGALLLRAGTGEVFDGSLWAIASLLLLLLLLFARNLLGGGDVKLMAALSLALTADGCYRLTIATAIFGGLLAVAYLLLRRLLPPRRYTPTDSRIRRVIAVEASRIRRGALPYGVAIAAAGIFVLLHPMPW